MKTIGVIPARYKSSRFPGKPLAKIRDKPMIWWVYNQSKKVEEFDEVFVATDDKRIKNKCKELGIEVIMTSEKHPTGSDRVAEVADKVDADLYVNIQGDEPLIAPRTIKAAINPFSQEQSLSVTNLMTEINSQSEIIDSNVPKVVVNDNNIGVFLSRSPIPYPKGANENYYKQVCVYGFTKEALKFYKESDRGKVEKIEDIEILRFIENDYKVKFIEVEQDTIGVDNKKDLKMVREIMQKRG